LNDQQVLIERVIAEGLDTTKKRPAKVIQQAPVRVLTGFSGDISLTWSGPITVSSW